MSDFYLLVQTSSLMVKVNTDKIVFDFIILITI